VKGRRVLIVEDGPTITHGGMAFGAGYVAAKAAGAREFVDPRTSATSEIREVFAAHPHIGQVLPAVGYSAAQLRALESSINASNAEVVITATPVDLARLLCIEKPVVRARYEFAEIGAPTLSAIIDDFLHRAAAARQLSMVTP
jgi:predicted GTPase